MNSKIVKPRHLLFLFLVILPLSILWKQPSILTDITTSVRSKARRHSSPSDLGRPLYEETNGCPPPTTRYTPGQNDVFCYPSSGGIWSVNLKPIGLKYLNIDRFHPSTRSYNQTEEDQFCNKLRVFGGKWTSSAMIAMHRSSYCDPYELQYAMRMNSLDIHREVGLPEYGGVWVLHGERYREWWGYDGSDKGLDNVLTMEEQCLVLERMGADYCRYIHSCPPLRDLLYEPRDRAKEVLEEDKDQKPVIWFG
ncbi:hypothetical protein ASPWEDRAFT_43585 [Aspergillus wentii DTO 134E9]|uniref:Uncharacterized protein n=1 Tax=Aspergillus wentii DTO 134E9 TaxID=1073089 RepID=A0A1L9RF56_ASPWE|nr:uncharacterized protein ASPWEDRAFT_43585 [Aspergillus wentii DTO 134E9]KAI9926229.1 hypothetical protein MW887_004692 [Aspergillus wentii]OJJ33556.1 hypothetical protein ASPWEDRAFT_43585 [Aspergillus wentii DTO 134E9]